jgi:hypothetical protein
MKKISANNPVMSDMWVIHCRKCKGTGCAKCHLTGHEVFLTEDAMEKVK